MQKLTIDLGARSYPIVIGPQLLTNHELFEQHVRARSLLVVTNETVGPLHLQSLQRGLKGFATTVVSLPDGEQFKTVETLQLVLDKLVATRMNRDGAVIALGGGVIGDIAGFAAACYQRGIAYAQVPTTLLAQVDSSVGGKTGVNHPGGKNLIGAFHQPSCVISDIGTLDTLPQRELQAGLAEVIKYGLICDEPFLTWLEQNIDDLKSRDPQALIRAVRRSCEIKAEIVAADEHEHGRRALLNLGHTFGHAVETATGYTQWLHGEAVAVGMLMAADLSARIGHLDTSEVARARDLVARAGLPVAAPRIGAGRAAQLMSMDKKVLAGRIRLVLLEKLGSAFVTAEYDGGALQATLVEHFGE